MTDRNRRRGHPEQKKRWRAAVVAAAVGTFAAVFAYAARTYNDGNPQTGLVSDGSAVAAAGADAVAGTAAGRRQPFSPGTVSAAPGRRSRRVIVIPFPHAITRAS